MTIERIIFIATYVICGIAALGICARIQYREKGEMLTWRKGMKLALKWQQESEARNLVGKTQLAIVPHKCETCCDQKVVSEPDPEGPYSFSIRDVPCPDCQKEKAA